MSASQIWTRQFESFLRLCSYECRPLDPADRAVARYSRIHPGIFTDKLRLPQLPTGPNVPHLSGVAVNKGFPNAPRECGRVNASDG